jgi:hypothetical protein
VGLLVVPEGLSREFVGPVFVPRLAHQDADAEAARVGEQGQADDDGGQGYSRYVRFPSDLIT